MSLKTIGPLTNEQRVSLIATAKARLATMEEFIPFPSDEQKAIAYDLHDTIDEHEKALSDSAEEQANVEEQRRNEVASKPTTPDLTGPKTENQ